MKIAHVKLAIWVLNIFLVVSISVTAFAIFKSSTNGEKSPKTKYVPESRYIRLSSVKSNEKRKLSDYQAIWTKGMQVPPPPPPPPPPPDNKEIKEPETPVPSINSLLKDYVIKGILINSNNSSESVVAIAKAGIQSECDHFHEGDYLDGENVNVRGVQVSRIEEKKVFFKFNGKEMEEPLYFDQIVYAGNGKKAGSNVINYGNIVRPSFSSAQTRRNLSRGIQTRRTSVNPQNKLRIAGPRSKAPVITTPLELTNSARFEKRFKVGNKTNVEGMLVTFVNPASALAAGGLQKGDIIKKINSKPVTNFGQMRQIFISDVQLGKQRITLEVERNGENLSLSYDVAKSRIQRPNVPLIRKRPR